MLRSPAYLPLALALVVLASCDKNGPGVVEGVANDVENEIDGAGDSIDGVGKDVTDTVDGPPSSTPPADATDDSESTDEDAE